MSRSSGLITAVLAAAVLLRPDAAAAQSNFVETASADVQAHSGWSLTPSLGYSGSWDDNVLVRGKGDAIEADFLSMVNPRATLGFNGRRNQLSATYDGSFQLYRQFSSLDSYDQRGTLYARRMLSPHVGLFVRNSAASAPTTELTSFTGIPFIRNGSRIVDSRGGVEAAFTKRTSAIITYDFQWVDFDHSVTAFEALRGGHSHGASASLRHMIDARLTLTADYDITHAIVVSISQAFDIQNAWAGADYKLSDTTRVFAAGGISRLAVTAISQERTGPAWRAGLVRNFRTAGVDLEYSRSFVPSYGFGGTTQNEEMSARLRLPLARRVYTSTGIAWRRNDPLTEIDLPLRSFWLEAVIGYAATPWVHLEGFYGGTHQTIDRPGGETDRNRVGFQVTTAKPVRIH